ncbi:MAG: MBL fold metallo-hydrolase [Spirochaetes bacterium]|nr:MBL fold metallo-hydrolase [Spirochaetota bacterium]
MTGITRTAIACIVLILAFAGCGKDETELKNVDATQKLKEHSKEFEKKIYRVDEGIYSAVGYGLANSILLVGKDGVIVIDTMETRAEGERVWKEFRKISRLPLKAVIYTHFHADHIYGAASFIGKSSPDIYAHETLDYFAERFVSETSPIIGVRSMRMFGVYLDRASLVNDGIGPYLSFGEGADLGYVRPTKTFRDRMKVTVAGIRLELIHAPGETDDQIYVWIPDSRVLVSGDNLYKAFPNLYTIRGTWFRSLKNWYRSVDIIRDLRPKHLVPCHGRPISGEDAIYRIATDYRDAIQYVHDQSLRGMNRGMTPGDLAEFVKLPPHLAASPYLQEFYGTVAWSARAMFAGNIGWFSGDSADLQPLSPRKEAAMIAEIAGGTSRLVEHAKRYADRGEHQAALQLTGHVLRLEPKNGEARGIRVRALKALGERESNPNARHYYLTEAMEVRDGFVALPKFRPDAAMVHRLPLSLFFDSLAVNLDAEACADVEKRVGFTFTDTEETYTIHLRRGVAEARPKLLGNLDIQVRADSRKWKEMLAKLRNPVTTMAGFEFPKGNGVEFARFMSYFSQQEIRLPFESGD